MKVIEAVRRIIKEQNLDSNFRNNFIAPSNSNDIKDIPREFYKNVVVSMHHFETVESEFIKWEIENKRKRPLEQNYPKIELQPPKDDVVEYSDSW